LTHRRPEDSSEFNTFLGCEVEFGAAADEIAFPGTIKDLPVISADSYLNDLLIGYCEEALARRTTRVGYLRSSVENAIAPLLPHGKARLGEIARKLATSQRTLARRLASEGLSFGKVLDELRADLAQRHLRDTGLSISQIAWLLGYQEVSAFTHAFRRWTGMTPREMRAQDALTRQSK
jgi:AraC-like DNA-binding protein